MKKVMVLGMLTALTLGLSSTVFAEDVFPGKQTASAVLDRDENPVRVIVDLSDGWSAEFASGAVYLYDEPNDGEIAAAAMGITLTEDVYEEYIEDAEEKEDFRTDDGITFYTEEDGTQDYFLAVGEDEYAFFMISVLPGTDGDAAMSRIAVRDPGWADEDEDEDVDEDADEDVDEDADEDVDEDEDAYEDETDEMTYDSEVYAEEDIDDAMELILEEFDEWNGCELYDLVYAGDECITDENLDWLNEISEDRDYAECIEFLMDFHSPVEEEDLEGTSWEPDADYTEYQWWLAREDDGEWEIVTYGY